MSQSPFALRNIRFGIALGAENKLEDTLWGGLTDSYVQLPMGLTAEKLGAKYGITRLDADELALASQTRWAQVTNQLQHDITLNKLQFLIITDVTHVF